MTLAELESALLQAMTGDDWVSLISQCFDAYDLSFGHGTENSRDEAYWLLRSKQNWDDAVWEGAPDPALIASIVDLVSRRVNERKPLAYLLGEAWFAGLRFIIDERVLVPRSPLSELISGQFSPWCRLQNGDRILDLGTGSGCLAVAAAHDCPGVRVDAVDVSPEALEVARVNVAEHNLGERVRVIESNLFDALEDCYQVIISNPPYVPESRIGELPREYSHEPDLALVGGVRGLSLVAEILVQSSRYLVSNGILVVEVGESREAFVSEYPDLPAIWLEFEHGGDGVFVLTRDELTGYLNS